MNEPVYIRDDAGQDILAEIVSEREAQIIKLWGGEVFRTDELWPRHFLAAVEDAKAARCWLTLQKKEQ